MFGDTLCWADETYCMYRVWGTYGRYGDLFGADGWFCYQNEVHGVPVMATKPKGVYATETADISVRKYAGRSHGERSVLNLNHAEIVNLQRSH